jgi:hypothetical protein
MRSRRNTARCGLVAALLAVALSAGSVANVPSAGAAADYEVELCTPESTAADGITVTDDGAGDTIITRACEVIGNEAAFIRQEARPVVRGGKHWTLRAPPGTKIDEFDTDLGISLGLTWEGGLEWRLQAGRDAGFRTIDRRDEDFEPIPQMGHREYDVGSESLVGFMLCFRVECHSFTPFVSLGNAVAIMEDLSGPTVTASGPLLASGPMRGVQEASFAADDQGSGIAEAALLVDGEVASKSTDENGGKCKEPYKYLVPCKLHVESSLSFDTSTVEEGVHVVRVAAVDAAGQLAVSPPAVVTIHNAPTNTAPPSLSGAARMGGQLAATRGEWEGSPSSFNFQWLRCDPAASKADVSSCEAIPGETQASYQPQEADVYLHLAVAVIASNPSGPEFAFSPLSGIVPDARGRLAPDRTAPLLRGVSLSPKRFRVGSGMRQVAASRRGGAVLRFSSSEAGRLAVAIQPGASKGGRRAHGTHLLTRGIAKGKGRIAISGRFGGRRLGPGRYRLTAIALDAEGNASKPAHLGFTIVP